MDALAELDVRRARVQRKINRYLETAGDDDDEKLDLQLKIACLERDIFDLKIALINSTNQEERIRKEQQIDTKEQLLIRLLPPQQTQVAQPGNSIFLFLFVNEINLFFLLQSGEFRHWMTRLSRGLRLLSFVFVRVRIPTT
jgi:hypothetical protein